MVNDTTTLNGSLMELGETLANNITSKGVSASASDGLTTLANKVLQISGGGSSITLSSNKSILSYYDSESATLTATYQTGATMELYNASTNTKIGNFTDNNDGTYTYTYSANGTGDIYLKAKVGSTESTSILIEDCLFYGINTSAFTIPSDTTFTSDGTKITATTNTSSEKIVYFNHNFSSSDDFLYEVEIAQLGVTQYCGLVWNDTTYYGGHQSNQNKAYVHFSGDTGIAHTWAVGDTYTVIKQNGTTTAYVNDDMIDTTTASYQSSFKLGFFINRSRTQYYKNIKIKLVNGVTPPSPTPTSISLSSNKNIISYYDSESATLTATYPTGATMELWNMDTMTKIGNFTENNGTYTYTYNSTGVGDINLIAKVGSDMSNIVTIEDCYLYAPTEISRTSTYNTDTYATMFNNFNFTSDNYVCELDIKWGSNSTGFGVAQSGGSIYHEINFANSLQSGQNKLSLYCDGTYRYDTISLDTYYTIKFTFEDDGTLTVYLNDVKKGEYTKSHLLGDTREIYWYEWSSGKTTYVKNVKIKEIGSSTPYSPCATYIAEIDSAIEYINGSGS